MGFCKNCGSKLKGSEVFCKSCGQKIRREQKEENKSNLKSKNKFYIKLPALLIILLVISLVFVTYLSYINYSKVFALKYQIDTLESEISNFQSQITNLMLDIESKDSTILTQGAEIIEKRLEIERLQKRVNDLEEELGITKTQLQETTQKYEEAKPYQERIERGQNLDKYYNLLGDYNQYTKPIILNYLGLTSPTPTRNDDELWERGRKVYDWISTNYNYCGDKGLRVGTTFYEFQFWSPDELLMSNNTRCGDCDDFATLFAGLMYASGVPEDKVWVVCGTVPAGGHCWNWLFLTNNVYRIDPVCSQKSTIINLLGLNLGIQGAYYTSTKGNVQCFSDYKEQMKMNPKGFYNLK